MIIIRFKDLAPGDDFTFDHRNNFDVWTKEEDGTATNDDFQIITPRPDEEVTPY